jgi:6-phosphogluconate dehydrogenase
MSLCLAGFSTRKDLLGVTSIVRALGLEPACYDRLLEIDEILDVAKQKGTGMWTSQSAMELQVPIPTIDLAVAMRDLSVFEKQREKAGEIFQRPVPPFAGDRKAFIDKIGHALHAAMIVVYAQGMAVLAAASDKYKYHLDLETVARIWRGGCIIRAVLLEDIRMAYRNQPDLPNLLLAPDLSIKVIAHEEDLRRVVCAAIELGLPRRGTVRSGPVYPRYGC